MVEPLFSSFKRLVGGLIFPLFSRDTFGGLAPYGTRAGLAFPIPFACLSPGSLRGAGPGFGVLASPPLLNSNKFADPFFLKKGDPGRKPRRRNGKPFFPVLSYRRPHSCALFFFPLWAAPPFLSPDVRPLGPAALPSSATCAVAPLKKKKLDA